MRRLPLASNQTLVEALGSKRNVQKVKDSCVIGTSVQFELRLGAFDLPSRLFDHLASESEGMSYADIASVCDDAIRNMALDGRKQLLATDVEGAFHLTCSSRSKLDIYNPIATALKAVVDVTV